MTLEVEPVVGGDNTTIDLNLVPQVVEFEGFINYGSPINAVGVNTVGGNFDFPTGSAHAERDQPAGLQHSQSDDERERLRWPDSGVWAD